MTVYRYSLWLCICFLLCVMCVACLGPTARNTAAIMHTEGGFARQRFDTGDFVLFGLLRTGTQGVNASQTLRVYIEGDGFAWITRTRPSADPTPTQPIALRMAQADPSSGPVLYLARPGQFVSGTDMRNCDSKYWTYARLAPEVIRSLDAAISEAKQRTGARDVALMGYSGGGGAAVLIAAQRKDVIFLGTVAGTLDHTLWTSLHKVSPLHASRNPVTVAVQVRDLPQRHMSSSADTVMPPAISQAFCKALGRPEACVVVSGVAHDGPWERVWEYRGG